MPTGRIRVESLPSATADPTGIAAEPPAGGECPGHPDAARTHTRGAGRRRWPMYTPLRGTPEPRVSGPAPDAATTTQATPSVAGICSERRRTSHRGSECPSLFRTRRPMHRRRSASQVPDSLSSQFHLLDEQRHAAAAQPPGRLTEEAAVTAETHTPFGLIDLDLPPVGFAWA